MTDNEKYIFIFVFLESAINIQDWFYPSFQFYKNVFDLYYNIFIFVTTNFVCLRLIILLFHAK